MGLFDRAGLPVADYRTLTAALGERVRVLAWAAAGGGPVVGLAGALAIRGPEAWRFIGWHEIVSGGWDAETGLLQWRESDGVRDAIELADPGALPDLFRERVEASIVVQRRLELPRGRAAMIVARRQLGGAAGAPLEWNVTRHGGGFDTEEALQAEAELARLRAEYDIA